MSALTLPLTSACECGRPIETDNPNSVKHGQCFKCRISNVGVTFRGGGGYGRANFHERTNAEFIRENDGPSTIPSPRK